MKKPDEHHIHRASNLASFYGRARKQDITTTSCVLNLPKAPVGVFISSTEDCFDGVIWLTVAEDGVYPPTIAQSRCCLYIASNTFKAVLLKPDTVSP